MELAVTILLFVIGLICIIKGGDWFVDSASWMAEVSGIPKFIVGSTIVSVATTLPELITSVIATADGKVDLAVGNAVGSVTANTGLILGVSLIFMAGAITRKQFVPKAVLLILSAATLLLLISKGGTLTVLNGIVLLAIFVVYLIENIYSTRRNVGLNTRVPFDKKNFHAGCSFLWQVRQALLLAPICWWITEVNWLSSWVCRKVWWR